MSSNIKQAAYTDALEQLDDYLELAMLLVKRHIARHNHRLLNASGRLEDAYVSFREASLLMRGEKRFSDVLAPPFEGWPQSDVIDTEVEAQRARMLGRLEATAGLHVPLPIEELRARYGLDESSVELLMCALAPQLSVDVDRLYRFARGDFTARHVTVGFLGELVSPTSRPVYTELDPFMPSHPLIRKRLLRLEASDAGPALPRLHQTVGVSEALVDFVRGAQPHMPTRLQSFCTIQDRRTVMIDELFLNGSVLSTLRQGLRAAAMSAESSVLMLYGAPGVGRRTALQSLVGHLGQRLMCVDLARLARDEKRFEGDLAELVFVARLGHHALMLRGERFFEDAELMANAGPVLARVLHAHDGIVAVTARDEPSDLNRYLPCARSVIFKTPDSLCQEKVWRRVLESCVETESKRNELAKRLSTRFHLTPGAITRAAGEATCTRLGRRSTKTDDVFKRLSASVEGGLTHRLGDLASPKSTHLSWNDVVLPEDVTRSCRAIMSYANHQNQVFQRWGFRSKVAYGTGLSCLFTGPPGTGKTMMAGILARSLDRELYQVDASRVVSKWIGETEKNLARLFDEAQEAQAILFFDEADSLFARRTQVRGANDRFANMEVNFLLQRMESYEGITILTTNLERDLDEAFKRRFRFVVNFPMPGPELRAELWKRMIPAQADIEPNVDFQMLGQAFEMSGGNIKNAVLRAAFRAAEMGRFINEDLLFEAAADEARSLGMLIRSVRKKSNSKQRVGA